MVMTCIELLVDELRVSLFSLFLVIVFSNSLFFDSLSEMMYISFYELNRNM